jgi:hypothetical protein
MEKEKKKKSFCAKITSHLFLKKKKKKQDKTLQLRFQNLYDLFCLQNYSETSVAISASLLIIRR